MTPLRQRMIEDMGVRNLAEGTQKVYVDRVAQFAKHFGKSPNCSVLKTSAATKSTLSSKRRFLGVY